MALLSRTYLSADRADENKGGALLDSPMRTAMHWKSRVSSQHLLNLIELSAISACHNKQNFRQFSHLWR